MNDAGSPLKTCEDDNIIWFEILMEIRFNSLAKRLIFYKVSEKEREGI
jgi:hypothetical protein